jgi:predicted nucleic acid-binding protein
MALRGLLGLPNVRIEEAAAAAGALHATGRGLELADALHLLRAPEGAEFVTFDRTFAKAGRKIRSVRQV